MFSVEETMMFIEHILSRLSRRIVVLEVPAIVRKFRIGTESRKADAHVASFGRANVSQREDVQWLGA